jgi:hypothetical protein
MPKGKKYLRPCKCVVIVGEALMPPVTDGRASRSAVRDFTARLHGELQGLFDQAESAAAE